MSFGRRGLLLLNVGVVVATAAWALSVWVGPRPPAAPEPSPPAEVAEPPRLTPPPARGAHRTAGGPLRWVVAGGGSLPELGQVQIEQDLAMAVEVLAPRGPGRLLFAGGPDTQAVQVIAGEVSADDSLRRRLAELFHPRTDRDATYRRSTLAADGPASVDAILTLLRAEAAAPVDDALVLFLAGHGEGGAEPMGSGFLTWPEEALYVDELAAALDESAPGRRVQVVVTSCFGGGFAEIAFRGGDPELGPAPTDRCGFFATTWDHVAAGCDANPDRGAQEGYGIHFLSALRGEDRHGDPLPMSRLDVDGDGAVSMLEAHVRAAVASRSVDRPLTTSERFLRAAVPDDADLTSLAPFVLPEAEALLAQLAPAIDPERFGPVPRLPEDEVVVNDALAKLAADIEALDHQVGAMLNEQDAAARALRGALLSRWPRLDDPWHPTFEATLAADGDAIRVVLDAGRSTVDEEELVRLEARRDELLVDEALYERLRQAHETGRRLAWLRAHDDEGYVADYERLRACENGTP